MDDGENARRYLRQRNHQYSNWQMSYDLYFYRKKGSGPGESQIAFYLDEKLGTANEHQQWLFENQDTEVYFSMELGTQDNDPESVENFESFEDFDNTGFSFNLNFMRPSFFGLEAFRFVDNFVRDVGLFVLNPQSSFDNPYVPGNGELFENWNITNLHSSSDYFNNGGYYYPEDESNKIWEYNFNRKKFQEELGANYFVSKVFFCKTEDGQVVTMSVWTQHIPNVLPATDYYVLVREYRKLWKTVEDQILIPRSVFLEKFDNYFEKYSHPGCLIIHPENAKKAAGTFNNIKSSLDLTKFISRIGMHNLYNARP